MTTLTGHDLACALSYPSDLVAGLPQDSVADFDGVGNPFAAAPIPTGCRVVVLGAGGGFDCFVAAVLVGPDGWVVGVESSRPRLALARRAATNRFTNLDLCEGSPDAAPVEDGWGDVVIANGVLTAGDRDVPGYVLGEVRRMLRPGGVLQFATITDRATVDDWCEVLAHAGFASIAVGLPSAAACPSPGDAGSPLGGPSAITLRARAR